MEDDTDLPDFYDDAGNEVSGGLSALNPLGWINTIADGVLKIRSIFGNDERNAALQAQVQYNSQIAGLNKAEISGQTTIETTRNITIGVIFIFAGVIAVVALKKK